MKESVLNGKSILAVNGEFGFQEVINLSRWKRHLVKPEGIFGARWGEDRKKTDEDLDGKSILAVNAESGVLEVIEGELRKACSRCTFDKATTFYGASQLLASHTYDLIILDIMGTRGFDLLERAVLRKLPVAILTAHPITPEALKRSFKMMPAAYLPREKPGETVPFLETVFKQEYLPGWKHLADRMKRFFGSIFKSGWEKKTAFPWDAWCHF